MTTFIYSNDRKTAEQLTNWLFGGERETGETIPLSDSQVSDHIEYVLGKVRADQKEKLDTYKRSIRIVFDGPPGPTAGRFVEVEDADGRSFTAGEWQERPDGLWQLVIPQPIPAEALPHTHVAGTKVGKHIDTCALCNRDLRDPIHT